MDASLQYRCYDAILTQPIDFAMSDHQNSDQNVSHSKADWQKWRDVVKEGVSNGHAAGADAGEGSASKLRDLLEKGIYRASYGVAYGTTFGAILTRDVVFRHAKDGASKGVAAAQKAAQKSSGASTDFTPEPDSGAAFSGI